MKKIVLCEAIILLLVCGIAYADEDSFEFKGIALGSPLSDFTNDKYRCEKSETAIADIICSPKGGQTIAEKSGVVNYLFYNDKLYEIHINISETSFDEVVASLKEKYGEVQEVKEIIKNKMGAEFLNKIYKWSRKKATLIARRYGYDLEHSSVAFALNDRLDEFKKRRDNKAKEKAKDL